MKKSILLVLLQLVVVLSFAQVSEEVSFTHEGYTIHGTFTKPASTGKYPLIVICPGSGANDRNGTLVMLGASVQCMYPDIYGDTLRTYKDLAEGLTSKGFAVLRYDKIEYTYTSMGTITFKKLWLPFTSGVDYAKTRNDVDASRIILIGHSEGGMLVPYAARLRNDITALINIAGARTPFDSLLAYQYRTFPRMCGQDTTQTDGIAAQVLAYFNLIRSGNWNGSTPPFAGVSAAVWAQYTHIGDSVVINYNLAAKPSLFLGLGRDNNVPVVTEYNRFQQEITTPATFVKLPDLIHYMNAYTEGHASAAVTDTIVYWLKARGLAGVNEVGDKMEALTIRYSENEISLSSKTDELISADVIDITGKILMKLNGSEIVLNRAMVTTGVYFIVAKGTQNSYVTKVWMH
ncbi:MAG: acetylxylan esterase [Bacteroidota bacterium]